jgi:DNA-binding SARP family transcriptional activator
MSPKDTAFLIHMALNKNRCAALDDLYRNFWATTKSPARNLSHLLSRLRKNLAVPSHMIRIQGGMLYWNVFFSTDHELFKEHIAKARFFEQAEEQEYAAREYERALALYRAAPFKGIYDQWSDSTRQSIINAVDNAREHFQYLK